MIGVLAGATIDIARMTPVVGEVTATAAMRDALLDIISVCDHVHDTFDTAVADFKAKQPAPMDADSK